MLYANLFTSQLTEHTTTPQTRVIYDASIHGRQNRERGGRGEGGGGHQPGDRLTTTTLRQVQRQWYYDSVLRYV